MISTSSIRSIIERLRLQRHRDLTKSQYYAIWKVFNKFIIRLDVKPNDWEDRLHLFVAFMVENNKKSSTIKSYISAIKSTLTENYIKLNEDRFLLNSLIRACRLTKDQLQARLPIKKDLLKVIINKIASFYDTQPYLQILYTSLVATAYFGLFRVGELTQSSHAVKVNDVHVGRNKRKLLLILRSSKTHTKGCKPQMVKISSTDKIETVARKIGPYLCPFTLLQQFIKVRRKQLSPQEQFFIFRDRSPV